MSEAIRDRNRVTALTAQSVVDGLPALLQANASNELLVHATLTESAEALTSYSDISAIKTSVQLLDNAIAGNEMQVDIVSMPTVTETNSASMLALLTTIDADTSSLPGIATSVDGIETALGGLALESGGNLATIATSIQTLDDAVFTDDVSTFTPGSTKGFIIGGVVDETATDSADEGDIATMRLSARRALKTDLDTLISGEDQTNNSVAVIIKQTAGSKYTLTEYQNNSFQTALITGNPANVFTITVHNTTASPRYFQIHEDVDGTISGGATAKYKWLVPPMGAIVLGISEFGPNGKRVLVGLTIANSTTLATYTAGTAGDLVAEVGYLA